MDETFDIIVGRLTAGSPEELTRFLDAQLAFEHVHAAGWYGLFHDHLAAGLALPATFVVGDTLLALAPDREGATIRFSADASALGRVLPITLCEIGEHAVRRGLTFDLALLGRNVQGTETSAFITSMRGVVRNGSLQMDAMLEVVRTWRDSGTAAALAAAALLVELEEEENEDP
ncbi:MAG TPA: hypothetical protein VM261_01480 [Kofleriaceae bacterium]|nr:hypothetical protein [Kofleriaceae bacterium]